MTFAVLTTSSLPEGIRGALTKWMLEIQPGTYVGTISKRIRDELWATIATWVDTHQPGPYAALIETSPNEQGFTIRSAGTDTYQALDHHGLTLITRHHKDASADGNGELPHPTW